MKTEKSKTANIVGGGGAFSGGDHKLYCVFLFPRSKFQGGHAMDGDFC